MNKQEFIRLSGGLSVMDVWKILKNPEGKPDRSTIHTWVNGRKRGGELYGMKDDFVRLVLRGIARRNEWTHNGVEMDTQELRLAGFRKNEMDCINANFTRWMVTRPNLARAILWGVLDE
jgi:hypothetical protein